jgi:hypothetical protein
LLLVFSIFTLPNMKSAQKIRMNRKTSLFFIFSLLSTIGFSQPSNDDCLAPVNLGAAPVCKLFDVFSNIDATASSQALPSCFQGGMNAERDVWFAFTTPAGIPANQQNYILTISGTGNTPIINPQVAVYRGDCTGGLSEWDCELAAPNTKQVILELENLVPGLTWLVRVNDYTFSGNPNAGEFNVCIENKPPEFIMGTDAFTDECRGKIIDDGGLDQDYSNNVTQIFTVCPGDAHDCTSLNLEAFTTEDDFDVLKIFSGNGTNGLEMATYSGRLLPRTLELPPGCFTLLFESDQNVNLEGFEISWACDNQTCDNLNISSCEEPEIIPSLPFSENNSTCNAGNALMNAPCQSSFLLGPEVVYAYDSPGDECIEVIVDGAAINAGMVLTYGCPDTASLCIANVQSSLINPDLSISNAFLEEPGRYYLALGLRNDCTDYDITINSVDCRPALGDVFECDNAANLNGCSIEEPRIFTIRQGRGDSTFLQDGINEGCWDLTNNPINYVWMYFRANADGKFGFLLSSSDPDEATDLDFQLWGPASSKGALCDFARNNQPVRSSYALPNDSIDLTGMVDELPYPPFIAINDECETAVLQDGFVRTLDVMEGEYYILLVNDYSGLIYSGEMELDLSPTTPGVLEGSEEEFKVEVVGNACPGSQVPLLASGGNFYEWLPDPNLSCRFCPDPLVNVTQDTQVFSVIIQSLCKTDTLEVEVIPADLDLGPDFQVCINENPYLNATFTGNPELQWLNFADSMSCFDCPEPQVFLDNQQGFYIYVLEADYGDCMLTDSVIIEVIRFEAPEAYFIGDTVACQGDIVNLGLDSLPDYSYEWFDGDGNLLSNNANPTVIADTTTTFFIRIYDQFCDVDDRMVLEVFQEPPPFSISNQNLCFGDSLVLDTGLDSIFSFTWNNGVGTFTSEEATPVIFPEGRDVYSVLVESHPICPSQRETFLVSVEESLRGELVYDPMLWCPFDTVQIFADMVPGGGSYLWENGTSGLSLTVFPGVTDTISFQYITPFKCDTLVDAVIINVENDFFLDPIILTFEGDSIFEGTPFTLEVTADTTLLDGFSFEWFRDSVSIGNNAPILETSVLEAGTYTFTVEVTSPNGCIKSESILIMIFPAYVRIPNVFFPASMVPENQVFGPVLNGGMQLVKMQVFNRWGDVVYDTSFRTTDVWDGTHNGEPAISDVYMYQLEIEFLDGSRKMYAGDVTLLR